MKDKYNQISVERYSRQLAKVFSDHYFSATETVNGQQLIHFSPIKQVNLFLIKELLQQWNNEMANLKSPYFDFENEEVKEALVQFMNVLSRKILIRRPHFEPLLAKSIADTFYWVLDPVTSFEQKFLQTPDSLSSDALISQVKYLSIDKELIRGFINTLPKRAKSKDFIIKELEEYLENHATEKTKLEALLTEFNALLAIRAQDILIETPAAPTQPSVPTTTRTVDELTVSPERFTPQPPVAVPVSPVKTPEPAPTATVSRANGVAEGNLNERYKAERSTPTLNDKFLKPEVASIANNQMSKKIESLKDSISINQRFSFINELFNGENIEYYQAIQALDKFEDATQAKNYVTQDLAGRYNWTRKEEHVNKLLRLIDRKFADA